MEGMIESLLPPLLRMVSKDCKQAVAMQVGLAADAVLYQFNL
jgi:hypothetical protein